MNKRLIFSFAAAATLMASATVIDRAPVPTGSGLRQITRQAPAGASRSAEALDANVDAAPDNAVEVPFTHQLGKDSPDVEFIKENYKIINANGDNRQWQLASVTSYTACMAPNADDIDANDDWLITMPVHMAAGKYVVSFDLGYLSGTGVILEVKLGDGQTVEAMTTEVCPPTTFTVKDQATYEYNCEIPADGYYYIGFHCLTTKELKSAVKLFSVSVRAGESVKVEPPAAGTLTWELAPKGQLMATVTYTCPTTTVSGEPLESISKVELTSRWTVDKFEFDDVVPGQVIVQQMPMYQGFNNRFTGVAYVGDTAGAMVEYKNIFCGKDAPLAPENVRLRTADDDYTRTILTWNPVDSVGENGGYVDPDAVTYYVFDAFGSYYDPAIAQTEKTSLTLGYPELVGQDFVAYQVTADYDGNYSLDTASNIEIVGEPAKLPFKDSFAGGLLEQMWALNPLTSYGGQSYGTVTDDYFASLIDPDDPDSPAPLKSFDGDNGFYYWLPFDKNVMLGLLSLRADISGATNPVLEFRYQGQGSTIDVLVAAGASDLALVKTINLKENPTDGWSLCRIPLADYKPAGAVNFEIRLTAVHNDNEHTWSVPLDAVVVRDLVDTDLAVTFGSVSAVKAAPGAGLRISAHIQNQGIEPADASAVLSVNGVKVEEKSLGRMAPDSFADAEFEYVVPINAPESLDIKVAALAEGDAVDANNEFGRTVAVQYAPYPGISDLSGTDNGDNTVELTWVAPKLDTPLPQTIFEDFESADYEPMSISGVGGWTVYDGDGARTINVFSETYNPYQTMPMAFQLFNSELANPYYYEDCDPHSGTQFMLAPTAYYADNDNWLISPELSGNAQTITFYAKSFSVTWAESMEVLWSATDNQPKSFSTEPLLKVEATDAGWVMEGGVPEIWEKYEVALPAGAKYFAIRHFGYYTCALFVDDITYEAVPDIPADLELEGYHVMRGDQTLTAAPIADTSYIDRLPAVDGEFEYTYTVVPVYNRGIAQGAQTNVKVTQGAPSITVADISDGDALYTLQGVRVGRSDIVPGVYILVRNGHARKTLVK